MTPSDRVLCGFLALFLRPRRIRKAAIVLKPATLAKFRRTLLSRHYHRLFSSRKNAKPGPKGPSDELVRVIVEMKRRNPRFGCPRIAQQINKAFGVAIDKDVVRRVLAKRYRPKPYDGGPSWLTFLRHTRDSVCSIALFQRKSILPGIRSSLLAIGQCTRRITRCGIASCHFNQSMLCALLGDAIPVVEASKSLSPAHDPPFSLHGCRRKLLGVGHTPTVPVFPRAPPFAERRIRTRPRNHNDYRSDCGGNKFGTELEALKNHSNPFLMPSPLEESRSAKFGSKTVLSHAERQNFARIRHCPEELRTLIAA